MPHCCRPPANRSLSKGISTRVSGSLQFLQSRASFILRVCFNVPGISPLVLILRISNIMDLYSVSIDFYYFHRVKTPSFVFCRAHCPWELYICQLPVALRFVGCRPWYLLCAHNSIVDRLSILKPIIFSLTCVELRCPDVRTENDRRVAQLLCTRAVRKDYCTGIYEVHHVWAKLSAYCTVNSTLKGYYLYRE